MDLSKQSKLTILSLPKEIKLNMLKHLYYRPIPKYYLYDVITTKSNKTGVIDDYPIWNNWSNPSHPQWMYNYSYGLGGSSKEVF